MSCEYIYGVVILAGGKGTRMGNVDKAKLKYKDRTFISILDEELSFMFHRYISTNDLKLAEDTNFHPVEDEITGLGPIGGIYSVLKQTPCDALFVLPCDMPFFSRDLIQYLIKEHKEEPVIYYVETNEGGKDREYPLCGIYTKACIPVLQEMISKNIFKMRQVMELAGGRKIEIPGEMKKEKNFININTPEDYQKL